jgi:hypothetical protein
MSDRQAAQTPPLPRSGPSPLAGAYRAFWVAEEMQRAMERQLWRDAEPGPSSARHPMTPAEMERITVEARREWIRL